MSRNLVGLIVHAHQPVARHEAGHRRGQPDALPGAGAVDARGVTNHLLLRPPHLSPQLLNLTNLQVFSGVDAGFASILGPSDSIFPKNESRFSTAQ
jgi:hypothetical protein